MLDCQRTAHGFHILYKNRMVLAHDPESPWICVGQGQGQFRMSHGSFKIRDELHGSTPLRTFEIRESSPERVEIHLGGELVARVEMVRGRLEISFKTLNQEINRVWIRLAAVAGEHIYGCGEQYTRLDLKGSKVPIWVEEQGIGRGRDLITWLANRAGGAGGSWYSTYFPQPTFVSSTNLFCHLETSEYAELDFTDPSWHSLHVWGVPEKIVLDTAETATALLESLSAYLGRQPALPDWVYDGMVLGLQGGAQVVQQKLETALAQGIQVTAVWAQDWVGKRLTAFGKQLMWNWRYNPVEYPDLPAVIEALRARGILFLGYINPFLALEGDLFQEARDKGYLVKNPAGEVYLVKVTTFPAALLDLTHPQAREWIKGVIKSQMIDLGLSGWMADFAEYLPVDAVLHSGESGQSYHNRYPVDWARVNHEALVEAGESDRVVFFSRADYTGTSRYSPLVWAGDQLVNWSLDDGLATIIPAALSLGFCGIGHHHADLGGYTTVLWIKRKKELFMRWAEASAFSLFMRTHEGIRPEANWQFDSDADTLAHLARLTQVHVALKPYLKGAAAEYQACGLPLIRHPYIHYEGDEALHQQKYQYLLGRDLLVAPVTLPRRRVWRVCLPRDEWVHLWSGKPCRGGTLDIPAPLGEPPVFYRAHSPFAELFLRLRTPDRR